MEIRVCVKVHFYCCIFKIWIICHHFILNISERLKKLKTQFVMLFRGFMKYEAVNGAINNSIFSRKAFETDHMVCVMMYVRDLDNLHLFNLKRNV